MAPTGDNRYLLTGAESVVGETEDEREGAKDQAD